MLKEWVKEVLIFTINNIDAPLPFSNFEIGTVVWHSAYIFFFNEGIDFISVSITNEHAIINIPE